MNSISFKNFRQFKDFPEMEFGGITFLVGKNNSGKSTIVKALLLMNDFISSDQYNKFSFGNNVLEDANIVTFGRALNNNCEEEDWIEFSTRIGHLEYYVVLSGKKHQTDGEIIDLVIIDNELGINFHIQPDLDSIFLSGINKEWEKDEKSYKHIENLIAELEKRQFELNKRVEKGELKKSSKEYLIGVDEISSQIEKLNESYERIQLENEPEYIHEGKYEGKILWDDKRLKESNYQLPENLKGRSPILSQMYSELVEFFDKKHETEFTWRTSGEIFESPTDEMLEILENEEIINEQDKEEKKWENLRAFFHNLHKHEDFRKKLLSKNCGTRIVYLGASPSKQAALFSIRDKNNSLAQAIHQFKQMGLDESQEEAFIFFKKWFGRDGFGIGENLEITPIAGEAYEVKVDGINLADRGMGSLQLSLLLFRISCVISKASKTGVKYKVVVEEPELNLHPRFQSMLAELFFEVNQKYGIEFIIETHSEYILRKSQVIVSENELEISPNENPFKIFYLDLHEQPPFYPIKFDSDGVLRKSFGTGFFDEASDSNLQLLKLKRIRSRQ